MPKLSVIIPAYHEELSVGQIVKKTKYVLKDIDHEIIVIDDGSERIISKPDSKVQILVIPTDEELMIAKEIVKIIK